MRPPYLLRLFLPAWLVICLASPTLAASTTTNVCPAEGNRVALTDRALSCGGSLPLDAIESRFTNLMDNPDRLAFVDRGVYLFHYYAKDEAAKTYKLIRSDKLPRFLCRWDDCAYRDGDGNCVRAKVKDVDIYLPLSQIFSYNDGIGTLYVRHRTYESNIPLTLDEEFVSHPKTIRIPIISGVPYVPKDDANNDGDLSECDLASQYYVTEPNVTGFTSIYPKTDKSCTLQQYFLADTCESKVIQFSKNQPNLILPPGTSLNFYTVQGRSEVMARASQDGIFTANYPSMFKLGYPGLYNFPTGVAINYYGIPTFAQDNQFIHAQGPSISLNAANSTFSMPNGGWKRSGNDSDIQTYPENTLMTSPYGLPHIVTVPDGTSEFHHAMEYPTLNTSYIRLPVDVPTE